MISPVKPPRNTTDSKRKIRGNPRRHPSFIALRKDGLCRRSESPRPFKENEKLWYRCAMECNVEEVKKFLEKDSSLAMRKDIVMTALHWAAKKGHRQMVELLGGTGMDINIKTGYTALHFAVIQGHEGVISILIDNYGADINIRDNSGRKPRHYLSENTSPWIQKMLGKTPKPRVSISEDEGTIAKSLETIGSLLLPMKPLSTSLGSGLDRIDSDDDEPLTMNNNNENENIPRDKPRSSSFVKFCHSLKGITKKEKTSNLEIPDDGTPRCYRTGRAKSAPDIKHIKDWKPRILLLPPDIMTSYPTSIQ